MSDEHGQDEPGGEDAARARRMAALRSLAADVAPGTSAPAARLEREVGDTRPARPARRWPVIAGVIGAALVILVIGPQLLFLRPLKNARAVPTATLAVSRLLSPRLATATVYIASNNADFSHLYAISAGGGQTRWRFQFGASYTTPVVAGSVLYTASSDGHIYALDAATGRQLWAFARPDNNDAYVTLAGATLYVDDDAGYGYALAAASGKQVWRDDLTGSGGVYNVFYSPPAVAGGLVYMAGGIYPVGAGALYAFDAATGALRWRAPTGFAANGMPVVASGVVYVTATDGSISAFRASSGAKVWSARVASSFNSGVAVAEGTLYAFGQDGVIYAVNAATGAKVWQVVESGSQGGYLNAAPLVANGVIYAGSASGALYALNASDGSRLWQYQASSQITSTPALLDGALYFGDAGGDLVALRASDGVMAWTASLDNSINASPVITP